MRIGIDIDDTISNTYEVQFNLAQYFTIHHLKRDGAIQQLDNLQTHFYTKYLHDWTSSEEEQFFDCYYTDILEKIEPKMFAIDIIKQLKEQGNEIYLVTARFNWKQVDADEITKKWLNKYQLPYDALITHATDKATIVKENHIDMFLDDSFANCQQIAKLNVETYLMDSRVNRALEDPNITRVYSWPHFYQKIKEGKKNGTV